MLDGKTAVITGSTSGIGLGVAQILAAKGCAVALNSFTNTDADHALAESVARDHGVKAVYIQADMSDATACARLIADADAALGAVDILVNNAGVQHVAPIESFPVEKWNAILAINLSSAFHTCQAAIPGMKARGWGRVVNIASAHGLTASPYKSAYVAAKHGIVGFSKTLALEFADAGLDATCNAVCPGYVWTPLVEAQLADQMKTHGLSQEEVVDKIMLTRQPTRKFATVDQIGEIVAFLCSDSAAQITGTTVSADGGWTAL